MTDLVSDLLALFTHNYSSSQLVCCYLFIAIVTELMLMLPTHTLCTQGVVGVMFLA